jgi:spermidine/putrescine transport system permease protein
MIALRHRALGALYWLLAAYLLLPLIFMAVMGLKDGAYIGLPIRSWTLKWFAEALADPELRAAFVYSMKVALWSTVIAAVTGVWTALALQHVQGWKRGLAFALICLPMVVPSIINAIGLRIFTQSIGLAAGTGPLVLGLASQGVPVVVLMVTVRLATLPRSQIEAARDLGAGPITAFRRVTLPWIRPAVLAAALFTALSSFDDFVRAIFLSGYEQTMPVLLYAKLTKGISPLLPAIATLIVLFSLLLGLVGDRITRSMPRRQT